MDTQLRPSRHRFELGRGTIAECGVTAGPIIEHFEPLEDILLCFSPCQISSMRHQLRFQRMKEALDDGIIPAVPAATHAHRDTMAGQELAVQEGGILGSAVRVVQQSSHRVSRRPSAMVSASVASASVSRLPIAQATAMRE
jgi:hypothetical protein